MIVADFRERNYSEKSSYTSKERDRQMRLSRSFFVNIKIFEDERNLANFLLALTIAFTLGTDVISQHGTQDEILFRRKLA